MIYPNIPEYRLDITGVNKENLIPGEYVARTVSDQNRILTPRHAPFFIDSVRMVYANGEPMVYGVDYDFFNIMGKLSEYTGKAVGCFIRLLKSNELKFVIRYQTVGSTSLFDQSLLDMFNSNSNDNRSVWWYNISGKPDQFPPKLHGHDMRYELYAFADLADAMGKLKEARLGETGFGDPYADFFSQTISNASSFLDQTKVRLEALIAEHVANKTDNHGLTAAQVDMDQVANIGTYTSANYGDAVDDQHRITPGYLKKLAENTQVNTDNFVQPGVLPIARYGENFFIPPVVDGAFKGVGTRQPWRVACLESNGYMTAIGNYNDATTDALMFMLNKTPFSSSLANDPTVANNEWVNTRYLYSPEQAAKDNVVLTSVIKGGDYRWMIVGNDSANRWYLVKCNGTFNPDKHRVLPIDSPSFITDIDQLRMWVCGNYVYLFKHSETQANGRKYTTMRRINIGGIDQNTSSVTIDTFGLTYRNSNSVTKTSDSGVFDPFAVVTDVNGKISRVLGNHNPVLDVFVMERDMHVEMMVDPENPTISYMRWWVPAYHTVGTKKVPICYSPVWKLTENNDTVTLDWVRGNSEKTLNVTTWNLNVATFFSGQDTGNTEYFNEVGSWFHKAACAAGMSGSSSLLSNNGRFSCASAHWVFFPLTARVDGSGYFTNTDVSEFTTGHPVLNTTDVNSPGEFLQSGGVGVSDTTIVGGAPSSGGYSAFTLVGTSTVNYEMMKSEIFEDNFSHTARVSVGGRTIPVTYGDKTYLRQQQTDKYYTTNIPSRGVRISYIDEKDDTTNGETFFSYTGGNVVTLGTEARDSLLTYSYSTSVDESAKKITFTPTLYVKITDELVQKLIADHFPAAAKDYYKNAWSLMWFPGKGNIISPVFVIEWCGVGTDTKSYVGVLTLNIVKDPTILSNQTLDTNGVKTVSMGVGDILGVNAYTYSMTDRYTGDRSWFDEEGNHYVGTGSCTVYRNSAGEVSLYWASTCSKNEASATDYGVAITAHGSWKFSGSNTIATLNAFPASRETYGPVIHAIKDVGLLLTPGSSTEDFLGGCITPASLAGTTYDSVINAYNNNALLGARYIVCDIIPVNQWNLYFSQGRITLKGTYFTLPAGTLNLLDYDSSPQNKKFYLYIKLVKGKATYKVYSEMQPESSICMKIAEISTDSVGIGDVTPTKVFSLTGFRVSSAGLGSTIPASTGGINETGEIPWISEQTVD